MNTEDRNFYGNFADVLEKNQRFMLDEIEKIIDKITENEEKKPVEHIKSRIKSADSMKEKLVRFSLEPVAENAIIHLSDAIGVRIVTHFVGDVYLILDEIKKSDKWNVVTVKDYIANSKPNGYRSLHILLELPIDCDGLSTMRAEIQLRTIAMDCWASLEHQLKYKKNIKNTELICSELKRCADEMASTDLSMQTIRELINQG